MAQEYASKIHEDFDGGLLVIDEVHNIRTMDTDDASRKSIMGVLEDIARIARGMTLVLMTATPM